MGTIYILISSILWGLIHSITASHGFKRSVRKLFGDPVYRRMYRFSYNLFAFASFFPVLLMVMVLPDHPLYSIPAPWVYLTTIMQGCAIFAMIAGVMQTGLMEFAGLAQLSEYYAEDTSPNLSVDGLYGYVRHPLYTAGLVFLWCSPEMTTNRLVLWTVFSLYIVIGAMFEERKLLRDFGEAYQSYKNNTPMLIPRLIRPKKTD